MARPREAIGSLGRWLGEGSTDFFTKHFGRAPYARPSGAMDARALFDWAALDRIVAHASDVIVVAAGTLREEPTPRSIDAVRELFSRGLGLVVRQAQREDAALRA